MMLPRLSRRLGPLSWGLVGACLLVAAAGAAQAAPGGQMKSPKPKFSTAKAFDVSPPFHDLALAASRRQAPLGVSPELRESRPERGPVAKDRGFAGDGAVQEAEAAPQALAVAAAITAPSANFAGLSNQDNFNVFGFRVNPPDPVGDVG